MRLIALSDSHGNYDGFRNIVEAFAEKADAFLFTGDGCDDACQVAKAFPQVSIYMVRGNNDLWHTDIPEEKTVTISGKDGASATVFLLHSHTLGYAGNLSREEKIAQKALAKGADIALYGHSHVPFLETIKGVLVMNPGSITFPRGDFAPSFGVIDVSPDHQISAFFQEVGDGSILERFQFWKH